MNRLYERLSDLANNHFQGGAGVRAPLMIWIAVAVSVCLYAQRVPPPEPFMRLGTVEHHGATATVSANEPRPLRQAIAAVGAEYGWVVDFEDPPYFSKFDLVDDTDPAWRASHPDAKAVTRIAGGAFRSDFPEPSHTDGRYADEDATLQKIVSDYNTSGNPGQFVLRKESNERYSVVGVGLKNDTGESVPVAPILDATISIPGEARTPRETLNAICQTLSSTTGIKVMFSLGPSSNGYGAPDATIGGTNVSARTLLIETMAAAHVGIIPKWHLLYDADAHEYILNIQAAERFGNIADDSSARQDSPRLN
jgi:hypothetical protein